MEVDETNSKRNPQPRKSAAVENLNKAKKLKEWVFFYIGKLNSISKFDRTPHRSAVLRAHYSWTSQLFLLMFSYCASSWYGEVPIRCFEMFDLQRASPEVEHICVQFPYTTNKTHPHYGGEKYYAPYYMWVHWLCLLLFMVFQIVHAAIFFMENRTFRTFVLDLENTYDYFARLKKTREYYQANFGSHYGMVRSCVLLNMIALVVNIFVFYGVDTMLLNNYWSMPWFLTVKRDCVFFDDPFSILFPPFAYCDITPELHIQVGRSQLFGCQLPLNETYAKFFMALWFWQAVMVIWSIYNIFYWAQIFVRKSSAKDLLNDGSYKRFPHVKQAAKKLSVDEALALSIIKPYLYAPHYRALVQSISVWDPSVCELKVSPVYDNPNFPDILENIPIVEENEREQDTIENFFVTPVLEPANLITTKATGDENDESELSDDPPKKTLSNKNSDYDSKASAKDSKKMPPPPKTPQPVATPTALKPRHPEGWNFPLRTFLAVNPDTRRRPMLPLPSLKHNLGRYKENSISDPYLSVAESPEPHHDNLLNTSCCSSIDLAPSAPDDSVVKGGKKAGRAGVHKSNSSTQDKKGGYASSDKKDSDSYDKKMGSSDTKPSAPEADDESYSPSYDFSKEDKQEDSGQANASRKRGKKKK